MNKKIKTVLTVTVTILFIALCVFTLLILSNKKTAPHTTNTATESQQSGDVSPKIAPNPPSKDSAGIYTCNASATARGTEIEVSTKNPDGTITQNSIKC